jgi:hypothetical protein
VKGSGRPIAGRAAGPNIVALRRKTALLSFVASSFWQLFKSSAALLQCSRLHRKTLEKFTRRKQWLQKQG